MAEQQPINAEVPAGQKAPGTGGGPPKPSPKRPRRPLPLPLKAVGGAILLVAVFIVAAILGGGDDGSRTGTGRRAAPRRADSATRPFGDQEHEPHRRRRPGGQRGRRRPRRLPVGAGGQQPRAVTLVAESDPAGAIAASVLMAAPVRAPILFTNGAACRR